MRHLNDNHERLSLNLIRVLTDTLYVDNLIFRELAELHMHESCQCQNQVVRRSTRAKLRVSTDSRRTSSYAADGSKVSEWVAWNSGPHYTASCIWHQYDNTPEITHERFDWHALHTDCLVGDSIWHQYGRQYAGNYSREIWLTCLAYYNYWYHCDVHSLKCQRVDPATSKWHSIDITWWNITNYKLPR